MQTRHLNGYWAKKYREAAAYIGQDNHYYQAMTEAVTGHINSRDFVDRADSFRHARKISKLILKVVHGRPDRHVAIRSYDSDHIQNVKQSMIDRGPEQAGSMITAFINAVGVNVLAKPEVRLPLKSACDQLPTAEREKLIGWMAAKFDLGDFSG